ncbi:hypothetical protein ZIOFF_019992 [Zingiber officinale]|uniref:Uncharacterized protein n=1 Tax=Zingiber officinale TaxID=94328 RepID=A0A8J5LBZ8_ZINOF|nr:hypothetical protein ZIOFF_019992 [Zingiber officinale]
MDICSRTTRPTGRSSPAMCAADGESIRDLGRRKTRRKRGEARKGQPATPITLRLAAAAERAETKSPMELVAGVVLEDGLGVGDAEVGGRSGAYGCCDKIRQRGFVQGRKKIDGRADDRGSLGDGFHELEKKMQGHKLKRSQSRGISRKLSPKS